MRAASVISETMSGLSGRELCRMAGTDQRGGSKHRSVRRSSATHPWRTLNLLPRLSLLTFLILSSPRLLVTPD